ncbi:hypothetical protein BH18ACI2_BH18ACI2_08670 [soil metagenome]
MSYLFIIVLILLAATAYSIYRSQRAVFPAEPEQLPATMNPPRLFDEQQAIANDSLDPAEMREHESNEQRASLLSRAAAGDLSTLIEAQQADDRELYRETLRTLVEQGVESDDDLRALARYIAQSSDLRADESLVVAYAALWRQSPDREMMTVLLRLAALSDDAAAFQKTVDEIVNEWQAGRIANLTAANLRSLIESEYWVLSSAARRAGGDSYLLKLRFANLRMAARRQSKAKRKTA